MPPRSETPSGDDATRPPRSGPLEWLLGFPRAAYDQGAQHGQDWHRGCAFDDSSSKKHEHHFRWHHHRCERDRQTDAESRPAGDASANWAAWLKSELDHGEMVAKGMYDSWDPKKSDPIRRNTAQTPLQALAGQLLSDVESDGTGFLTRRAKDVQMEQMPFWGFYMLDPYSPLRLEHEAGFDASWRTRFEDLIRAEKHQEPLSKEDAATTQRQSAFEWFHGLQSRVNSTKNSAWQQSNTDQKTELDAYNQALPPARPDERDPFGYVRIALQNADAEQDMELGGSGTRWLPVARPGENEPLWYLRRNKAAEPEAKSVFRTVNRYTERDGSITTKTVVRKTFADGKTEKTETVETSPRPVEPPLQKMDAANPTQAAPRRGWFWSS